MKFDSQLRPATETLWVVSYGGKTSPRWWTAAILKIVVSPYLSLVTFCSHNSGRCAVELYHASHLWYPPFYTSPMAVLSNIELPALRRKVATDKLVEKIVKRNSWPIQPDIFNPPLLQLTSRKLLWLDLQPVDIKSRWRHNWKSAQVVNSHLVCNPTIRQLGFDLSRQQWSLLNCFHMEQGHCGVHYLGVTLDRTLSYREHLMKTAGKLKN